MDPFIHMKQRRAYIELYNLGIFLHELALHKPETISIYSKMEFDVVLLNGVR